MQRQLAATMRFTGGESIKFRFFPIARHAVVMAGRTLKSYALLSVTIVLSFSLLLGYLVYTDSSLYNDYKGGLIRPAFL